MSDRKIWAKIKYKHKQSKNEKIIKTNRNYNEKYKRKKI